MRNTLTLLGTVFAWLILVASQSVHSDNDETIPAPVLEGWKNIWEQKTSEFVDEVVVSYADGYAEQLEKLGADTRTNFLDEMRTLLLSNSSWEALGNTEVPKLLISYCGLDLLEAVSPVYEGELQYDSLPEETQKQFLNCYTDVDLYVSSIPVYRLQEVASEEFLILFTKYGIDGARDSK